MKRVNLLDESVFATGGGLWTGKKGPFAPATVIRNTNFTESGRVDYSDVAVLEVEEKQLATRRLRNGDIIIERSGGGPNQPVGRVVFFDREDGVFSHSNFTSRLRVIDTKRFLPQFVFYFLLYFHDSKQTDHLQRRTTGIRNLDWRAYRETACVPLLGLHEQRAVAQVLSAVQRAIERQERLIALTAELKKALMHKLFTEGTRGEPLKQTDIGLVPKSWTVERFDRRFKAKLGKMLSQKAHTGTHPCRYLRNKNIQWGRIDLDDLLEMDFSEQERKLFELRKGDLLVCEGGEPGRAAIWEGAPFECYYQKALHRVRPLNETTTNDYLFCWLAYAIGIRDLYGTAGASSTIAHLPGAQLNALLAPFPPREEQDAIADAVAAVLRLEGARQATSNSLRHLFRALLHQLMTAQVRVHDLDLSVLDKPLAAQAGVT